MVSAESFRSMTALAHAVPGASLRLEVRDGAVLRVSACPDADLHPCQLRQVLLVEAAHDDIRCTHYIDRIEVEGALRPIGPGLFGSNLGNLRCFATLLAPGAVEALAAEIDGHDRRADSVQVTIKPDSCLGVSIVLIDESANDGPLVEEIAAQLAGQCAAGELVGNLRRPKGASHRGFGIPWRET